MFEENCGKKISLKPIQYCLGEWINEKQINFTCKLTIKIINYNRQMWLWINFHLD